MNSAQTEWKHHGRSMYKLQSMCFEPCIKEKMASYRIKSTTKGFSYTAQPHAVKLDKISLPCQRCIHHSAVSDYQLFGLMVHGWTANLFLWKCQNMHR